MRWLADSSQILRVLSSLTVAQTGSRGWAAKPHTSPSMWPWTQHTGSIQQQGEGDSERPAVSKRITGNICISLFYFHQVIKLIDQVTCSLALTTFIWLSSGSESSTMNPTVWAAWSADRSADQSVAAQTGQHRDLRLNVKQQPIWQKLSYVWPEPAASSGRSCRSPGLLRSLFPAGCGRDPEWWLWWTGCPPAADLTATQRQTGSQTHVTALLILSQLDTWTSLWVYRPFRGSADSCSSFNKLNSNSSDSSSLRLVLTEVETTDHR